MKALVTGATGFAGTWLCRALMTQGWDVTGWSRNAPNSPVDGVRYCPVDICDQKVVRTNLADGSPDVVFHLAAMSHVGRCASNPLLARQVNRDATEFLFSNMPPNCRGIFTSSCHVYGKPTQLPIREEHPLDPTSVYAETKSAAETAVQQSGRDVVILRPFHHTGPGQSTDFAISNWAHQVKTHCRHLEVGNVQVIRDYTDVRDVVQAYIVAAKFGHAGAIYNVCTGKPRSLESIAHSLIENTAMQLRVTVNRQRQYDIPEYCGDPTKITSLGWRPRIAFHETLRDMLS